MAEVIRKPVVLAALLGLLAAGIVALSFGGFSPWGKEASGSEKHVTILDANEMFDVNDDELLVGFASDVFVGKVAGKQGEKPIPGTAGVAVPRTRFEVKVSEVVEGDLAGKTVTVDQIGGETQDGPMLVEGTPLLKPGSEYLLVTKKNDAGGYSIVSQPAGVIELDKAGEKDREVKRFKGAKANEKQFDPKSLPENRGSAQPRP